MTVRKAKKRGESLRRGYTVFAAKEIKDSEACGGDVARTATAIDLTRVGAEDAALDAARDAAKRACVGKKCGQTSQKCAYIEKSTSGSSGPVTPPTNPVTYTATMTTTGVCGCE